MEKKKEHSGIFWEGLVFGWELVFLMLNKFVNLGILCY